jgi:hypothetical protein
MAVSHGMDVGEVRRLGGSLQASAGRIDSLITRIESAVSGSTWVGPDASMFKNQWWPEHKAHLKQMSEKLHGLGQSALNNAAEQERVSGIAAGHVPGATEAADQSEATYTSHVLQDNRREALIWADQNPGEVADLIHENLEGNPPKELLYFDPERGMIAWVTGDLASANEVVFVIPGTGVDMAKASGSFTDEAEGYMAGRPRVAVVSALTWNPPSNVAENSDAFSDEASSMIEGPTASLLTSLGEQGKNITLVGHSAGATAVQQLLIQNEAVREHVDAVALLATPDLDGQMSTAMEGKPIFVGYTSEDDMKTWAEVRGQIDNIPSATIRVESANLGIVDSNLEDIPIIFHPAHGHSRYVSAFADDIAGLLPSTTWNMRY